MHYFKRNKLTLQNILVVLIVIIGIIYVRYKWIITENDKFDQAKHVARSVVAALPIQDLKALEAKPGDINKPQYKVIKHILKEVIRLNSKAKFAYLYTEQNGRIFFYADSENEGSKDYSPPGQEYTEGKMLVRQPFRDGYEQIAVYGTDRWGSWTSVLIPIKDELTGKTIAVFGMDFGSKSWANSILIEVIDSSISVGLLLLALFLLFKIKLKNQLLKDDIISIKKAEKLLLEREEKYRFLFYNNPQPMWIYDLDTLFFLEVNSAAIHQYGYSREEFLSMTLKDIHPSEDISSLLKDVELTRRTLNPAGTWRHIKKSGELIFVEITSHSILYNGRNARHVLVNDITESKKATEDLLKSETRLRTLLQTIPDPIIMKDKEGVYLGCNPMFERYFGASEADIIGKTDYDFVEKELADFFRENDRNALKAGKPTRNTEWITFADDGHIAFLETIKTPMYDDEHNLIGLIGIGRDITAHKKAEEALAESEIKYRAFFENSMDAILLTSPDGITLAVNQSACNMFGYSEQELLDLGRSGVVDTTDPQLSIMLSERAMKQKVRCELTFIRKDGTRFPAEISSTLFKNNDGLERTSMIIRDITMRKEAEAELIAAKNKAEEGDRLKSAFLANMSHEIRTPMNGILGFAALLKEPDLNGDEQQEFISIIEKSGARMLNIINDIICISKVESGQMELSIKETNINEQIEYIYTFFKPEAVHKGIKLSFNNSLPTKEAFIKTDKEKLYAILTNLVKNALKFTHSGNIEIGYQTKPGEIEFFVKDTGTGIPSEQIEYIFERFRQGSESLNRNYEGAGLGLSISRAYVEMLGGKIWVESDPAGKSGMKGSVFYFTIPCNLESSAEKIASNDKSVGPVGCQMYPESTGFNILIAEDDITSAKLMELYVKEYCKKILKVKTGSEAVETCRNNPDLDLVLMDIKMSDVDGYEATRQIRQFNPGVVIIAQTAFALTGDREKAIVAGCNDYIAKPFGQHLLISLIEKHLNKGKNN